MHIGLGITRQPLQASPFLLRGIKASRIQIPIARTLLRPYNVHPIPCVASDLWQPAIAAGSRDPLERTPATLLILADHHIVAIPHKTDPCYPGGAILARGNGRQIVLPGLVPNGNRLDVLTVKHTCSKSEYRNQSEPHDSEVHTTRRASQAPQRLSAKRHSD